MKQYPEVPEISFKHLFPDGNRIRRLNSRQMNEIIDLFLSDSRTYSSQKSEEVQKGVVDSDAQELHVTQSNVPVQSTDESRLGHNLNDFDRQAASGTSSNVVQFKAVSQEEQMNPLTSNDLWSMSSPLASLTRSLSDRMISPISVQKSSPDNENVEPLSIFGAWDQVLKPSVSNENQPASRWTIPLEMKSPSFGGGSNIWSWNPNEKMTEQLPTETIWKKSVNVNAQSKW